uniref:Uncharacterized protein n=1 Tax=Arundo donax TaxID=35708 RepID=A0A0A9FBB9_ARUDO
MGVVRDVLGEPFSCSSFPFRVLHFNHFVSLAH